MTQKKDSSSSLQHFQVLDSLSRELDTFKSGIDKTHIISITDAQGIILYVNDLFCQITKYTREELIGQDHKIINSGYHSREFISELWKTISAGSIWTHDIRNKAKDNSFFWLDSTLIPFLDETGKPIRYFAISQNITKQKQAENRTTRFFELSKDYLCVINNEGHFEQASPVFLEGMGATIEELQSTSFHNYILPEDMPVIQQELEKLAKGEAVINFESRLRNLKNTSVEKLI